MILLIIKTINEKTVKTFKKFRKEALCFRPFLRAYRSEAARYTGLLSFITIRASTGLVSIIFRCRLLSDGEWLPFLPAPYPEKRPALLHCISHFHLL